MTGDDIKAYRKKHGLTQAGLADLLGVELRSVQYWEDGRIPSPKFVKLVRMIAEEECGKLPAAAG